MGLDIYNKVKEIIGVVPTELEFLYAIGTFVLFCVIIFVAISPFIVLYRLSKWEILLIL